MDNAHSTDITSLFLSELVSASSDSTSTNVLAQSQRIPKIKGYVTLVVMKYNDIAFQSHFRLTRSIVEILTGRLAVSGFILSTVDHGGKEKVPILESFLTLWYFTNNETFRQISDRFNVSLSSTHRILLRVVNFILSLRMQWPTNDKIPTLTAEFRRRTGIDNVLGAIDGCHVRIEKPKLHSDSYVNRKGYHSILIQGVVTPNKTFSNVYCDEPGSIHDAHLCKSAVYRRAETQPDAFGGKFLVGDSAYPSLRWLVPPFKDNGRLTAEHKMFNYRLSSTRIVVEHTFGLLKGRFRILKHRKNESVDFITQITMACCVLHNICMQYNDQTHIEAVDVSGDLNDVPEPWSHYVEGENTREAVRAGT